MCKINILLILSCVIYIFAILMFMSLLKPQLKVKT